MRRLFVLGALLFAVPAHSDTIMIGDEVMAVASTTSDFFSPNTAIVGAGTEFWLPSGFGYPGDYCSDDYYVDIGDTTIRLDHTIEHLACPDCGGTVTFYPIEFFISDLDWVGVPSGEIVDVQVLSSSGYSLVEFDAHSVTLRRQYDRITWGSDYLRVEKHINVQLFFVPEPTTALLLATGLAGLAAAGRRRALH